MPNVQSWVGLFSLDISLYSRTGMQLEHGKTATHQSGCKSLVSKNEARQMYDPILVEEEDACRLRILHQPGFGRIRIELTHFKVVCGCRPDSLANKTFDGPLLAPLKVSQPQSGEASA
jgi:hypothetical protein